MDIKYLIKDRMLSFMSSYVIDSRLDCHRFWSGSSEYSAQQNQSKTYNVQKSIKIPLKYKSTSWK